MDLLKRFCEFVHQHDLFHPEDRLLLAVSGGVDSVVLCDLCIRAGYHIGIAHCNFQLRGGESERDEQFVRQLGKKYGAEVWVKRFDTENYAAQKKIGIQEAARDLRYAWFEELSEQNHFSCTVLAHHADDNIETVLMNFCRGTGLRGLEGMAVKAGSLRRPLLDCWKEELMQFAKENLLEFVEDSSNQSSKYARNLFRNEIIPLVAKVYPQVKSNLKDNIRRFSDIERLYAGGLADLKRKLYKLKNGEVHIPVKLLLSYQNRALIFEIISDYGFGERQIDELLKLAGSDSGKFIQSPDGASRIIKFRNWLIVSRNSSSSLQTVIIDADTRQVQIEAQKLKIEHLAHAADFKLSSSNTVACLDAKNIQFPLLLRKWKQGDYFYPLGMRKKKKLGRFLIDQKLSKTDKEKMWVLEMNGRILWVVGLRIDERFKITDKTKTVLKLSLEAL